MEMERSERAGPSADTVKGHAGKFLTFILDEEEYGVEILRVREIIGVVDILALPQAPDYVKGIINLRGTVIPIIDLRLKFGFPPREYDKNTCIIVINRNDSYMGMVVDTVSEVLNIAAGDMEPAPGFGSEVDTSFILGIGKVKGKVKILLDIDKVLGAAAESLAAHAEAA